MTGSRDGHPQPLRTKGLLAVTTDLELHSAGLLEWLYDNSGQGWTEIPGIDSYLETHEISKDSGYVLVDYLADRGLVKSLHTLGGPDGVITLEGVAFVQRARVERRKHRIPALRTRMLLWLDEHERSGSHPVDWSSFLVGPDVNYDGDPYTEPEVAREADYLKRHSLINAFEAWGARPGWSRPTLTPAARDCITDHGGNVSDYLNRGNSAASITNITMSDNSGNFVVASNEVVQNVNNGFDARALLDFAGFVRQVSPTLGLTQDKQTELNSVAADLHAAASSPTPEPGRLRRLVNAILDGIRKAAPTVVQTTAITMGEKAIEAITGI